MENIFINRSLLVVFFNIFYHRSTAIVFRTALFNTSLRLWRLLKKKFCKSSYIYVFYPKTNNFHNSENIGRRKPSDPSMNNIFNVLSIGLQNSFSFRWPDFDLKCLVTMTEKGHSLKFKAIIWKISIPESARNCNSILKLVDGNRVIIMEQKRKIQYSWHVLLELVMFSADFRIS